LPEAAEVLIKRATEKGAHLEFVSQHPALKNIEIILEADFPKINTSLAIALTDELLQRLGRLALVALHHLPIEYR
jgi:hypothetical protein